MFRAYANNVKCMYTSVPGHIVDCSESICGLYPGIVVSCAHELIGICGLYVAFEGHFLHILGNKMFPVT